MGTQERMERNVDLIELFWNILFGWRQIICFGIIFALLFGVIKYLKDYRNFQIAQHIDLDQEEAEFTAEEEKQIEEARAMMKRIENYQKYMDTSALMQVDPYSKPIIELQYYVESDYTYNYTQDNYSDYTTDLMSLYYNYVKSGEMSNKLIENVRLSISQADFSELCSISQIGETMAIGITWTEEEKLEEISEFIKSELSRKETDFQEVGSHRLKLLRESQNVIVDIELAERKNTFSNNVTYITTQLNALKATMSEQQLKQLGDESEQGDGKEAIAEPNLNFKFIILGAACGVLLLCIWIAYQTIFAVKLQKPEEIHSLYNVRFLGEIAVQSYKRRFLSVIDEKLLSIKNRRKRKLSMEQQVKIVSTNVALSCKRQGISCIYMTGSEYENINIAVLNMLKKELSIQNIQTEEGGNVFYDADSLKAGTEIGNILFVEQKGKSHYDEMYNELNLIKEQNNYILGVVVLV